MIASQREPGFGAKKADPVNFPACVGDMLFETPAQPAIKIKLPVLWAVVVLRILARQRVIARTVEMRAVQRYRIGKQRQVIGIKVDHIAQHRLPPFFCMKGQHFADAARFAKGKKQIFGVKAVIDPLTRCGGNDGVDGRFNSPVGAGVIVDPVHGSRDILRQIKAGRHQCENGGKPCLFVVVQGCGNLRVVFDKDDGDGAF